MADFFEDFLGNFWCVYVCVCFLKVSLGAWLGLFSCFCIWKGDPCLDHVFTGWHARKESQGITLPGPY